MPRRRPAARVQAEMNMPQRHRTAENTAVVETERRRKATQKTCSKGAAKKAMPQRQERPFHPAPSGWPKAGILTGTHINATYT